MGITTRDLWTVLHGMGFGTLFMLAFTGALVKLYRLSTAAGPSQFTGRDQTMLAFDLFAMVALA